MIKFKDVSFRYKNSFKETEFALENIMLDIKQGECVLLCGVSGCGKTSICRIINGLIPNYFQGDMQGEVLIRGKDTNQLDMVERASFSGNVFQNPKTQFFNNNMVSEIAFTSENMGVSSTVIRQQVEKQMNEFDLHHIKDNLLHQMSGGEKQRVACAAASAMDQSLLILDEPSSNLDYKSIEHLKDILQMWKKQGKTIVISEHRLYFLKDIVDKVYVLDKGNIVKKFTRSEFALLSDDELNSMGLRSLLPIQSKSLISKSEISASMNINNLHVKYKGKKALTIPELSMNWQGVCAIVGDNGAGKSTFINALSGLIKSKKGKIVVNGKVYSAKDLQRNCYIVAQDVTHQLFSDSVYEEIACTNNITEDKIDILLKELNLYHKKDVHPMSLSGGEKQRLSIAVALSIDKNIIFFDEPTSGLDFYNMQKTSKLINELSFQNKIIFVITHDIEFIINACSHVLEIKNGQVVQDFSLQNHSREQLFEIFKGESER